MKFFDKKYFELAQGIVLINDIQVIPDKKYTAKDIEKLYNERLKIEMEEEKEKYNALPDFSEQEELTNAENIDFNEFIYVDEQTGKMHIPKTKKEVLNYIEREKKEALKRFEERPPFNEEEFVEEFKENYEFMLENDGCHDFPDWVFKEVDKRILALNYLPKSIFEKIKLDQENRQKELDKIRKSAQKELDSQHIPSKIKDKFDYFYDSRVRAFKENKNDYQMRLVTEFEELVIVTFKNAKIIENEKMDFRKSYVCYLGEELYLNNKTYEVHMIFSVYKENGQELKYITLTCEDIKINKEE
ncbi:MAG: hypothetical protein HFJ45_04275 [Clostridia bacterium]|nr:hypothetical protein [Clostridia bacterium]